MASPEITDTQTTEKKLRHKHAIICTEAAGYCFFAFFFGDRLLLCAGAG